VAYVLLAERYPNIRKAIFSQPVKKIDFLSDGVLSAHWASAVVSVKKDVDIMDVNILEIRDKLKLFRQIKYVEVKRAFPDTIRINVKERRPILRVLVQKKDSGKITKDQMFVDSEGVVFHALGYSKEMIARLPYLDCAMIRKAKHSDQYECTNGIDGIATLMSMAEKDYPNIYSQFEVVSCDKIDKKRAVPWQRIKIRCSFANEVIFSDNDLKEQLKKLDFVLSDPKVSNRLPLLKLDFTLGKEVVVKFKDNYGVR
jgi:hypothetical protein